MELSEKLLNQTKFNSSDLLKQSYEIPLTFLDSATNILTITNLGVNELSRKKTSLTINNKIVEKHYVSYALGFFSGLGIEAGAFIFSLCSLFFQENYWYLLGYSSTKLAGFTAGRIYNHHKNLN